jgi:MFS family permease
MRAAVLVYFVLLGLTEGMWVARIPGVKAGLHLTDGLLGASLLVGPAGLVAVMPLAGRLADQFGSARLIRHSGAVVMVLPLFLWTASTLPSVLMVVLALCAVFFAGIVVPAQPAQDPPGGILSPAVGAALQPALNAVPDPAHVSGTDPAQPAGSRSR